MTVGAVDTDESPAVEWMVVVISENNGAPGSWRWNVKRHSGTRLETIATSDQTYLAHDDALLAGQGFMSAEQIWNLPATGDG